MKTVFNTAGVIHTATDVIPTKAGIHAVTDAANYLDSRLRHSSHQGFGTVPSMIFINGSGTGMTACLALFALFLLSQTALAERRPPDTMMSDTREIPAAVTPLAGGVSATVLGAHDRTSLGLRQTVGEVFVGEIKADACTASASDPCAIQMGYGYFEFYSDRLPIQDVELTINGGKPITNRRQIEMTVDFKDDLSGLRKATFIEQNNSLAQEYDLMANHMFSFTLGQMSDPPENKTFSYAFQFEDRAGNKTLASIVRTVTLDMTPPTADSVVINGGNRYVNGSTVNVTAACYDAHDG